MASTTTRQTTAARKRAAPKPPAVAVDFEPIHIPSNDDFVEERVPLFYIGDTEYSVPTVVPPGVALEYLREVKAGGQDAAAGALLSRVLGEEAYSALETSRALTEEQLNQIIDRVMDLSLGREVKKEGKVTR